MSCNSSLDMSEEGKDGLIVHNIQFSNKNEYSTCKFLHTFCIWKSKIKHLVFKIGLSDGLFNQGYSDVLIHAIYLALL